MIELRSAEISVDSSATKRRLLRHDFGSRADALPVPILVVTADLNRVEGFLFQFLHSFL